MIAVTHPVDDGETIAPTVFQIGKSGMVVCTSDRELSTEPGA